MIVRSFTPLYKLRYMTTKHLLFLVMCTFVSLWGYSQCDFEMQPDATTGIDATCYRYALCEYSDGRPLSCDTTRGGNQPHLYMSVRQLFGLERKMRSFLKFDFSQIGNVPTKCLPTKATLTLYHYENSATQDDHIGNNAFYIERITEDWAEDTIRWQDPVSSKMEYMPAATSLTGAQNQILVPKSANATSDYTIDISEMVKFWFENPDQNFGVRLRLVDETLTTEGTQVHLASSNYPDPNLRPKINITFPCMEANAGNDMFVCVGDQATLSADGGAEYEWFPIDASNDPLSDNKVKAPNLSPTKDQSFYVSAKLGSCTDRDTIEITTATPGPASIIDPTTSEVDICKGDSVELKASGASIYEWIPAKGLSDANSFNTFAKPDTSTTYTVLVSNLGDKCPGKAQIRVNVQEQLDVTVTVDETTICLGDSTQLVADGSYLYEWSPQETLSDNKAKDPWAKPTKDTCYTLISSEVGQCSDYDTVCITVIQSSRVDAGPDKIICNGDSVQLDGTGDGTFLWSNSNSLTDPFRATPLAYPSRTTKYVLEVDGSTSCAGKDSMTVTVVDIPEIEVSLLDTSVCPNEDVIIQASKSQNYIWSTGETTENIVFSSGDVGTNIIKLNGTLEENGQTCYTDTVFIKIGVIACEEGEKITPPKFVTPNGDLINDKWVIAELDAFPENEITIFNRWGDVVYQKSNYDNSWDGTYSGQSLPEDTYLYIIKVNFRGEWDTYNGTVTIVRDENSK